jgi:hypothetical protein
MATIITLSQNLDLLSFDLLLPLLNWTASILDKNLKYLVNLKQVIQLLAKILINMPEETSREIVSVVLQIIEKCLYVENPEQQEQQAQRSNISNLEFIHQYYVKRKLFLKFIICFLDCYYFANFRKFSSFKEN